MESKLPLYHVIFTSLSRAAPGEGSSPVALVAREGSLPPSAPVAGTAGKYTKLSRHGKTHPRALGRTPGAFPGSVPTRSRGCAPKQRPRSAQGAPGGLVPGASPGAPGRPPGERRGAMGGKALLGAPGAALGTQIAFGISTSGATLPAQAYRSGYQNGFLAGRLRAPCSQVFLGPTGPGKFPPGGFAPKKRFSHPREFCRFDINI